MLLAGSIYNFVSKNIKRLRYDCTLPQKKFIDDNVFFFKEFDKGEKLTM